MDILMLGYICIHLLASANVWLCCRFSYIFVMECQILSVFLWGRKSQWNLKSNRTLFLTLTSSPCFWVGFVAGSNTACHHITIPQSYPPQKHVLGQSSTEAATSGSQDCREWEKVSVESYFDQPWLWSEDEGWLWKVICTPQFNLPPLSKSRKIKGYLFLLITDLSKHDIMPWSV